MGAVQSARTGYSKGSQVKGWGEVLAHEKGRVVEARGPGRRADGVTWKDRDFVPRARKPLAGVGQRSNTD